MPFYGLDCFPRKPLAVSSQVPAPRLFPLVESSHRSIRCLCIEQIGAMPTLASVIVLKIQSFSSRAVAEQTQLKARMEALVTLAIEPLPADGRIVLDLPDGLAVVVLDNPRDALELAERAQAAAAALPIGIGGNHGPVTPATDALRGGGLTGDGLATGMILAGAAQPTKSAAPGWRRSLATGMILAGAAQPGRFLLSRAFYEALRAVAPSRAQALGAAGVFTDRNVRTHELFALDPQAAPARRRRLMAAGTLAVIGILGLGFAARSVVQALLVVPPAIVKFAIKPGGEIYVDGILKGNTPPLTSLELKPGPHSIEVRNTTFPPLRLEINLASAEETTIKHTFERPRAPARAARKPEPAEKSVGDHFRELGRKMGF